MTVFPSFQNVDEYAHLTTLSTHFQIYIRGVGAGDGVGVDGWMYKQSNSHTLEDNAFLSDGFLLENSTKSPHLNQAFVLSKKFLSDLCVIIFFDVEPNMHLLHLINHTIIEV
jgi:hypothetical protein